MKYSPFRDPKFYVVVLNVLISLSTLIVSRYFPGYTEIVAAIIAGIQAVSAVLLKGYFDADTALRNIGQPPRAIIPNVNPAKNMQGIGPQPK